MKKLSSAIICIVLCLGLLAGCGSAAPSGSGNEEAALREPLIGTWNQITDDGSPSLPEMGIPSAYIFNADVFTKCYSNCRCCLYYYMYIWIS